MLAKKTKQRTRIKATKFARVFFHILGRPFSFRDRNWLIPIFRSGARNTVLRTGRQVSKSTSLATKVLTDMATHDYFAALYVSPTSKQTTDFSSLRLAPMIKDSPVFRYAFWTQNCTDAVFKKSLKNKSVISLGSAFHDADSLRGLSADMLCLDEVQDLHIDAIHVLEKTLFASKHRRRFYCGTPKTTSHAIETYWNASTQNYWGIRCPHCNHWNLPLGEKNLSPDFLCCRRCSRSISADIMDGQWVESYPNARFKGWHISQLMCPWTPWEEIYEQYHGPLAFHISRFYNEVLGFPYDVGQKPITEQDIIANCDATYSIALAGEGRHARPLPGKTFAGLDWAMQSPDISYAPSYTILTICGYVRDRLQVLEIKKYLGHESDPDHILKDIVRRIDRYDVELLACDWGAGHKENQRIKTEIGPDRMMEVRYTSQKEKMVFNHRSASFNVNRTMTLEDVFDLIKHQKYLFPNWNEFAVYAKDILGVFVDTGNRYNREIRYMHAARDPDDFLHSLNYATLAARFATGQLYVEKELYD